MCLKKKGKISILLSLIYANSGEKNTLEKKKKMLQQEIRYPLYWSYDTISCNNHFCRNTESLLSKLYTLGNSGEAGIGLH